MLITKAFKHIFLVSLSFLLANVLLAQEKTSRFVRYSADISYGFPYYNGDFYSFFGASDPYDGSSLALQSQYNQSSISGSFTIPFDYGLSFRVRATQAIVYFTEQLALVNFKNSMYDFSFLVQYQFSFNKFNTYLYGGVGYHTSSNASIYTTMAETRQKSNFGEIQRMSSTAGIGFEYLVWKQFSLFIEADYYLTGSDRFDGYNGFEPGELEKKDEKNYFLRDKLITGRAGVKVYFFGKAVLTAEKKYDKKTTSNYVNPYSKNTLVKIDSLENQLPEELRKLGVKKKLTGYSLQVNRVFTIDELKRQKASGEKVISNLQIDFPNTSIELLMETNGFSIHIGGFGSYKEAKSAMYLITQYYSAANVIRH